MKVQWQVRGYLIGAGVHPMVDDRIDLYSDKPPVFDYSFLDENRVDWTFIEIEVYPQLEQALNADPEWVSLYRGPHISVHARKSALEAVRSGGSSELWGVAVQRKILPSRRRLPFLARPALPQPHPRLPAVREVDAGGLEGGSLMASGGV